MSTWKLTLLTHPQDLSKHQLAWRKSLCQRSFDPYIDPLWYNIWWQCFGQDARLYLLHITGELDIYIPFACQEGELSLMGNVYSHRQGFAAHEHMPQVTELVLQWIESSSDWDRARLPHLPSDGPETRAIRTLTGPSTSWLETPDEPSLWCIPDNQHQQPAQRWKDHLASQSREARRKRQRITRRAEALQQQTSALQLTCFTAPEDVRPCIQQYFQILAGSWKEPESSRDFFRQIGAQFAQEGWFRSYVLSHQGRPIACQLGFLHQHTYFCYKTAYLQQYACVSPGLLVMDMAFNDLMDAGLAHQIDLLTGDGPYKQIWCNVRQPQSTFLFGQSAASPHPAATQTPQGDAIQRLAWTPQKSPLIASDAKGQWTPIKDCPPLAIAIATGAPNLQSVEARYQSDHWSGIALVNEGQIEDAFWIEERPEGNLLHLPPPFVRVPRPSRMHLLNTWLQQHRDTLLQAHVPVAHIPVLRALGFVDEQDEASDELA